MDEVVARLRAGDEAAFTKLVSEHHRGLVRLARTFVGSEAAAEEVAQETWVAVLDGVAGFEERSSLKTWIFRILVNRAKTRAKRQGREIPFDVQEDEAHPDEPRFSARGFWGGPRPWAESDMDDKRIVAIVRRELDHLPDAQRAVVVMRDVEGLDAKDVCNVLGIQETHQRVLLHRARTKLRAVIEKELGRP
jgi:RNA polymerase sigma-70 factor (ECF subfamily)